MSDYLRGKVHLNANDQSQAYRSKKKNLNADLHHNKNLNIFDGDGYIIRDLEEQPYKFTSYDTESASPNINDQMKQTPVPRKSPLKEKYGKLGSLYNPNNVDPRNFQIDPMLDKPAGVITNYRIGDSQN